MPGISVSPNVLMSWDVNLGHPLLQELMDPTLPKPGYQPHSEPRCLLIPAWPGEGDAQPLPVHGGSKTSLARRQTMAAGFALCSQ